MQACRGESCARTRMDCKQNRLHLGEREQRFDCSPQELEIVDEGRPVKGDQREMLRLDTKAQPRRPVDRRRQVSEDGVDHRVSYEVDAPWIDALSPQVRDCAVAMGEQKARKVVC